MNEETELESFGQKPQSNAIEEENSRPDHRLREIEDQAESLIEEAKNVHRLLQEFEQTFQDPEQNVFYIISANWLKKWKLHTGYDQVIKGQRPDPEFFGQADLEKINDDITYSLPRFVHYFDSDDYRNVFLKPELSERKDYEIITEATWDYFSRRYMCITVKRYAYQTVDGKKAIEVALKQINIVPISHETLRGTENNMVSEFSPLIIQASNRVTIDQFKSDLAEICSRNSKFRFNFSYRIITADDIKENNIRLWKLSPEVTLPEFYKYCQKTCKETPSYYYKIPMKGTYLEKDLNVTLEEAQIAANDFVILEGKDSTSAWNLVGDSAPVFAKCDNCSKYGKWTVHCACKKVSYCSEDCLIRDKRYHQRTCDKADELDNQELQRTADSRLGVVGLQNLGNTCFMNSGLQCLSNLKELTEYFLAGKFASEINETNPLGTKGKLVQKYATFLKNMWFGTSSVYSPWSLKAGIAEFQSMFAGYQQHDSQELISFLVDGIHEDLNRLKTKFATETIESAGQPDYEVAKKSWENHLKRNQSIIVDLFHGQFKSRITCPTCNRVSITFDPFNSISLPIPQQKKEKKIDILFISANNRGPNVSISLTYDKATHTVAELKAKIAELLNKDPNTFFFGVASHYAKEIADENIKTNELRKKKKYDKKILAMEFSPEDLSIPQEDALDCSVSPVKRWSYNSDYYKTFSFVRTIFLSKKYTNKQVYAKIFKFFRFLYDGDAADPEGNHRLSDEEAFTKIFEEAAVKPFALKIKNSYYSDCSFCGEHRCRGCVLRFDDTLLSEPLSKVKDSDFNLEFEIAFNESVVGLDLEKLDKYPDFFSEAAKNPSELPKEKLLSIYNCFEEFELPERLGEENAWYCNVCKEFQKADKKMEIYKAPPILTIFFKRFKSGASFMSKGKMSDKIYFPVENLDISDYVINEELPTDYDVERIIPQFNTQTTAATEATGTDSNTQMEEEVTAGNTTEPTGPNAEISQNGEQAADSSSKIIPEETKIQEEKTQSHMLLEGDAPPPKLGLQYDLFGVVNHFGSLGFGHYTAYAKNFINNKWYNFDDSRVSEEKPEDVCTAEAYVLFYRRRDWEFKI